MTSQRESLSRLSPGLARVLAASPLTALCCRFKTRQWKFRTSPSRMSEEIRNACAPPGKDGNFNEGDFQGIELTGPSSLAPRLEPVQSLRGPQFEIDFSFFAANLNYPGPSRRAIQVPDFLGRLGFPKTFCSVFSRQIQSDAPALRLAAGSRQ